MKQKTQLVDPLRKILSHPAFSGMYEESYIDDVGSEMGQSIEVTSHKGLVVIQIEEENKFKKIGLIPAQAEALADMILEKSMIATYRASQ